MSTSSEMECLSNYVIDLTREIIEQFSFFIVSSISLAPFLIGVHVPGYQTTNQTALVLMTHNDKDHMDIRILASMSHNGISIKLKKRRVDAEGSIFQQPATHVFSL